MSDEDGKMTFLQHLEELRRRLIRCALAVIAGMVICWFFREQIRTFLEAPLYEAWRTVEGLPEPEPLKFTSLLEPFIAYLKLAAIGGLFLAAPVILYNLWKFVSPGLYPKEKKVALPFVFVSTLLFVGGSTMAYSIVFPIGFSFFLNFAAGGSVERYEAIVELTEVSKNALPVDGGVSDKGGGDVDEPVPVVVSSRPDGGVDPDDAGAPVEVAEDAGVARVQVEDTPVEKADVTEAADATEPGEARGPPEKKGDLAEKADAAGEDDGESEEEKEAWWELILNRILMEDCGKFAAAVDSGEVTLRYEWDEARCKDAPELETLTRGEDEIEVVWKQLETEEEGLVVFEALDIPLTVGAAEYELAAVIDPEAEGKLAPMLMVKDYLSFAIRLLLAFGIVFELPVLITFLALAGIVNYKQLLKFSRWFIVLAIVFSAMLTPPDIVTQLLLALPLVVLYFLSVLVAFLFGPKPDE